MTNKQLVRSLKPHLNGNFGYKKANGVTNLLGNFHEILTKIVENVCKVT